MGDRFYLAQIRATGTCPGAPLSTRRRKKVAWTDEQKQEAIDAYEEANPTPETSTEIVKAIAEEMGQSPNGVRMILTKAGVYVKQAPAASASKGNGGSGGGRVSKQASQEALSAALTEAGVEIDADIVSKLTGKAAVYFTQVVEKLAG